MIRPILFSVTAALFIASAASVSLAQSAAEPALSGYAQLDAAKSVTVMKFSEMKASANTGENIFGSEDDDDLAVLRTRVAASSTAMNALKDAGAKVEQVIALSALGDGAVTLFVNDL